MVEKRKTAKRCLRNCLAVLTVPPAVLFSNQFLKDLDKLWELRYWIPDPTKPIIPSKNKFKERTVKAHYRNKDKANRSDGQIYNSQINHQQ